MAYIDQVKVNNTNYDVSCKEAFLQWGGQTAINGYAPIDAALNPVLSPNRLAGINPAGITVEYSTDAGSTWTAYSLTNDQKQALFTTTQTLRIGGPSGNITANARLRITIDGVDGGVYTALNKFHLFISTNYSNNCKVYVESYDYNSSTEWHKFIDWAYISGWSGWNVLNFDLPGSGCFGGTNNNAHQRKIRFTFKHDSITSGHESSGLQVLKIYGYGGVGWTTNSLAASQSVPYAWDANGNNCYFPYSVSFTGNYVINAKAGFAENGTPLSSKYATISSLGTQVNYTYNNGTLTISTK